MDVNFDLARVLAEGPVIAKRISGRKEHSFVKSACRGRIFFRKSADRPTDMCSD